ncbi:hypothetical protein MHH57_14115 [Paenibacillus sp. FSL H7-0442]|uniref:hypothetical protein n=1 Tax=Paenibacillus sp. FSL H7-0442 TaxID=2921435 RepID=UPI003158981F
MPDQKENAITTNNVSLQHYHAVHANHLGHIHMEIMIMKLKLAEHLMAMFEAQGEEQTSQTRMEKIPIDFKEVTVQQKEPLIIPSLGQKFG